MTIEARLTQEDPETLLRAFASLTHRLHELRKQDEVSGTVRLSRIQATKRQRDLIQNEILRRMT